MPKIWTGLKLDKTPTLRRESGYKVPPITKELFAVDTYWERESEFSPVEYPWVYQPHSRVGPISRSSCPKQNRLHVFRAIFSFLLSFCLYVLILFVCFERKCLVSWDKPIYIYHFCISLWVNVPISLDNHLFLYCLLFSLICKSLCILMVII